MGPFEGGLRLPNYPDGPDAPAARLGHGLPPRRQELRRAGPGQDDPPTGISSRRCPDSCSVATSHPAHDMGQRGLDGSPASGCRSLRPENEPRNPWADAPAEVAAVEHVAKGVPAHRPVERQLVWKQELGMAGQWAKRFDDGDGLRRQGHDVLHPRLHPIRRDAPEGSKAVRVLKLLPLGAADLARPAGGDREQAQCQLRRRIGRLGLDPAQHPHARRRSPGGFYGQWGRRPSDLCGGSLRDSRRHGVGKTASMFLPVDVRRRMRATLLDAADGRA